MIFYFFYGIILGSFLGVLAKRIPIHKNFVSTRSESDHCQATLSPIDLVPFYRLVFHKNNCRHCKQKIPLYHSLFELLTGSSVILFELTIGIHIDTLYLLILWITGLTLSLTDYLYLLVEPNILYSGSLTALLFFYFNHAFSVHSLSTPLIILSFFYLLTLLLPNSIGGGDIKLLVIWGIFFPLVVCLKIILIASLSGIIFILLYQILFNKKIQRLPFVPFLTFGLIIITLFFK